MHIAHTVGIADGHTHLTNDCSRVNLMLEVGIKDFNGTVGGNVSGTSDLAPLDQQAAMIQEWFPDAKNVGLLYCSAEANSQYQVDVVKAELEKLGYTIPVQGMCPDKKEM